MQTSRGTHDCNPKEVSGSCPSNKQSNWAFSPEDFKHVRRELLGQPAIRRERSLAQPRRLDRNSSGNKEGNWAGYPAPGPGLRHSGRMQAISGLPLQNCGSPAHYASSTLSCIISERVGCGEDRGASALPRSSPGSWRRHKPRIQLGHLGPDMCAPSSLPVFLIKDRLNHENLRVRPARSPGQVALEGKRPTLSS